MDLATIFTREATLADFYLAYFWGNIFSWGGGGGRGATHKGKNMHSLRIRSGGLLMKERICKFFPLKESKFFPLWVAQHWFKGIQKCYYLRQETLNMIIHKDWLLKVQNCTMGNLYVGGYWCKGDFHVGSCTNSIQPDLSACAHFPLTYIFKI